MKIVSVPVKRWHSVLPPRFFIHLIMCLSFVSSTSESLLRERRNKIATGLYCRALYIFLYVDPMTFYAIH
jgi:hypothetical protein